MPNKEDSGRHRMVVEEIEIPNNSPINSEPKQVEDETLVPKSEILDQGIKVSSQEVIENKAPIYQPDAPQDVAKEKSPVFWILIPGIFILGAILGGVYFYQNGVNTIKVEPTPTPAAVAITTPTPSSSPSATIDVSKFDVAVFNGSGIAGEAGKVKDLLTTAGFNVVSTGNAATYDYTKTIIKAKSTVGASVIQKIKDALSKVYVLGDSQTLSSSSTTDIQIVVGSSKAE